MRSAATWDPTGLGLRYRTARAGRYGYLSVRTEETRHLVLRRRGGSDKPGYWENTSLLKNSDGEMVKRTVRILVYEKNPANYVRTTDEYT